MTSRPILANQFSQISIPQFDTCFRRQRRGGKIGSHTAQFRAGGQDRACA